jgi:hypothetical protein
VTAAGGRVFAAAVWLGQVPCCHITEMRSDHHSGSSVHSRQGDDVEEGRYGSLGAAYNRISLDLISG